MPGITRLLAAFAVLVLIASATPPAANASHADSLYTTGSRLYSDGDYNEAEDYFRQALALDKNHVSSMFMLAETIALDVRRLTEAEGWYRKVLDSPRADKYVKPRALLSLGKLYILLGRQEDALDCFKRLIADYPDYYGMAAVYNHMGVAAYRLERYDRALDYFKAALEKDPMLMEATFNMKNVQSQLSVLNTARYQQRIGNNKAAIEYYDSAIESYPNYVAAWYQLGLLYLGEADYDQAIKHLERARVLNHGFASEKEIPYQLAAAFAGRGGEGDLDTALGFYDQIGTYKDSGLKAGEIHLGRGELDKAEKLIEPYTSDETERHLRAEANYQLGLINMKEGNKNGALSHFQKALSEAPDVEKYKSPPLDGFKPAPEPEPEKGGAGDETEDDYSGMGDYY